MAYSVQSDLNLSADRLVELTDSAEVPSVVDAAVLAREQARASATVDMYLRRLYVVPVAAPIPPELTMWEAAIWKYRLFRYRDSLQIPPDVAAEYKEAMAQLELVRERQLLLDVPKTTAAPVVGVSVV